VILRASATKTGNKTGDFDLPMSNFGADLLTAHRAAGVERGGWVFPMNSKSEHFAEPKWPLRGSRARPGSRCRSTI
jgi:hypothetical protein